MTSLCIALIIAMGFGYIATVKRQAAIITLLLIGAGTMALGITLDQTLGTVLGLWNYPHVGYNTAWYWAIMPLAWYCFGVITYAIWSLLTVRNIAMRLILVTAFVGISLEFLGHIRGSWLYTTPQWIVVIGWIPLVATITLVLPTIYRYLGYKPTVWEVSQTTKEVK